MEERAVIRHEIAVYKFDATIDTVPTFNESYDLESIDVHDSDNGDGAITRTILSGLKPTSISFAGCTGLLEVTDISIDGNRYIGLFEGCTNLTYVNMNNWTDAGVTHTGGMFRNCTSLKTIDMEDWDKTNLINITSMFNGCSSLTTIKGVENLIGPKVQIGDYIFYDCSSLTEIDVSGWDNRIYDMRGMFYGCSNLTKITGIEKLVTKYNGYIMDIFSRCSSLTEIDVSGWDVSNVTHGYQIFEGCNSLVELDLSNWDISKFISLSDMFSGCTNLRNVFMLNWNSSNCTSTYRTFYNCKNIKLLDFSNWDFKLVTSMNGMIYGCTSLETIIFNNIDLRSINNNYQLSASPLPLLKNIIIKNSTATNINKLIELLPDGGSIINSELNCKIYLPLTQDMSKIDVVTANSKGWKVTQGGIVHNVSKVLIEDSVVFEYDGISEGKSTCFAPTFGCACGVKIADVTEEETAMYVEAIQNNGCVITYDTGDGVIIEETTHEVGTFLDYCTGVFASNHDDIVLIFSPKAWSWYYAHANQYVNDPGIYIIQNQLNNNEGYAHDKFRCLKVEILGLKSTKNARLKRGEFINDTIKKTVVGDVPNITYK